MGALPVNDDAVFDALKSLDYDWASNTAHHLLKVLQTSVEQLKSLPVMAGVIHIVLNEYSIYENDPDLFTAVVEWLEVACLD